RSRATAPRHVPQCAGPARLRRGAAHGAAAAAALAGRQLRQGVLAADRDRPAAAHPGRAVPPPRAADEARLGMVAAAAGAPLLRRVAPRAPRLSPTRRAARPGAGAVQPG